MKKGWITTITGEVKGADLTQGRPYNCVEIWQAIKLPKAECLQEARNHSFDPETIRITYRKV